MYKCGVCSATSKPGEPLIKYVVTKPGSKDIGREIPLCRACAEQVRSGQTISQIARSVRNVNQMAAQAFEAAAPVRRPIAL